MGQWETAIARMIISEVLMSPLPRPLGTFTTKASKRKPSGKDRSVVKAARKQRNKK